MKQMQFQKIDRTHHASLEEAMASLTGPFLNYRFEVKPRNNEEAFNFVKQAIADNADKALQIIVTPGIDVAQRAYFYVGVRRDRNQLNIKILANDEIGKYILAFLAGATELPEVKDMTSTITIDPESQDSWYNTIEDALKALNVPRKEQIEVSNGTNYLKVSYKMERGKVSFTKGEVKDIFSILSL